jgi:hypothetical protein
MCGCGHVRGAFVPCEVLGTRPTFGESLAGYSDLSRVAAVSLRGAVPALANAAFAFFFSAIISAKLLTTAFEAVDVDAGIAGFRGASAGFFKGACAGFVTRDTLEDALAEPSSCRRGCA